MICFGKWKETCRKKVKLHFCILHVSLVSCVAQWNNVLEEQDCHSLTNSLQCLNFNIYMLN